MSVYNPKYKTLVSQQKTDWFYASNEPKDS